LIVPQAFDRIPSLTAVTFDLKRPRDGDAVYTCGFPLNAEALTTASGAVATAWGMETLVNAKRHGLQDGTDIYRLDLRNNPGNSGAPVFDLSSGHLIGIAVETLMAPGGYSAIVVPSHYVTDLLEKNHIAWRSPGPASQGHN
jgi:S1-C subfamily serine protease